MVVLVARGKLQAAGFGAAVIVMGVMQREGGVNYRPRERDGRGRQRQLRRAALRCAEFEHDRGDAGKRADRSYQQDQKAAIVLQHRVTADMGEIAAKHHDAGEHQIERNENIPANQETGDQPQRARQQKERRDTDGDRKENARPRIDHADRPRHLPEAEQYRIVGLFACHRRLQFLRSATNRAAARSTSPLAPKIESAVSARANRSRTRCLAPSIPSWVTKVVLPKVASCPVCLPSAAASPSTSSRSSAIWKASPSARP